MVKVKLTTMPRLIGGNRSSMGNGMKLHIIVSVDPVERFKVSRCGIRSMPAPRSMSFDVEIVQPINAEKLMDATGIRNEKKFCHACLRVANLPMKKPAAEASQQP